jgi:hypothetical protein
MADSSQPTPETGTGTDVQQPLPNDPAPENGAEASGERLLLPPHPPLTIADLDNIQGDVILGLPKEAQKFFLFTIVEVDTFRKRLVKVIPLITTSMQTYEHRQAIRNRPDKGILLPTGCVNIAFSWCGLQKVRDPWQ